VFLAGRPVNALQKFWKIPFAPLAAKLCNKYRRQLPENIADAAKAALQ
jgi:hypothetical protein